MGKQSEQERQRCNIVFVPRVVGNSSTLRVTTFNQALFMAFLKASCVPAIC
eukprot:TRINITY_DN7981_c0_g1_i1.p3 TRINITY_DN7981_c0_g1~~TRINITY_DN7981_c0_g1_i1.p3  ORF type:complete len:51 (-),score=5.32 TRINITY_DN7981_c0_g1_i1:38-190(-)